MQIGDTIVSKRKSLVLTQEIVLNPLNDYSLKESIDINTKVKISIIPTNTNNTYLGIIYVKYNNKERWHFMDDFITLTEHRNNKLKQLINN